MVLALIVQHTAITVSALSMLHDRRRGMFDLFRMSPIASGDLLTGKYAAFALLGTVVALAVLAVLVFGFGVPFLAGPGVVVGAVALLVLASIGIGIVVALVSDSDRQAVQVALLVLLASVFFSGLALDLDQFSAPVRAVSALLPVTQAGSLLQDLMLRGETTQAWRAIVLAAMAGILFVAGWLVLRRQLHRPAMSGPNGPAARSPRRCEITVGRGGKGASRHIETWHMPTYASNDGAIVVVAAEDDRFQGALKRATDLAAKRGEPLILYDWDAPSLLSEPMPTWWSSEGWDRQFPDRLDPDQLDELGAARSRTRSGRPATAASTRSAGCRPTTARAALAQYATGQSASIVVVPRDLEELHGLDAADQRHRATGRRARRRTRPPPSSSSDRGPRGTRADAAAPHVRCGSRDPARPRGPGLQLSRRGRCRSSTRARGRGSRRWRSRPPGPTSGSRPIPTAICSPRASTPGAASSTATTRRTDAAGTTRKYERIAAFGGRAAAPAPRRWPPTSGATACRERRSSRRWSPCSTRRPCGSATSGTRARTGPTG